MTSLFDRIAHEVGGRGHANDATTETLRPSVDDSGPGGILLDMSGSWPAPDISTQMDRPRAAERQCARSGCSDAAAVTLTYHYAQSQVWIDNLWPAREPHMYDLCMRHAARLSVPRGWHLDDRRHGNHAGLVAV